MRWVSAAAVVRSMASSSGFELPQYPVGATTDVLPIAPRGAPISARPTEWPPGQAPSCLRSEAVSATSQISAALPSRT